VDIDTNPGAHFFVGGLLAIVGLATFFIPDALAVFRTNTSAAAARAQLVVSATACSNMVRFSILVDSVISLN
jgi:uncharacterized protein with PQ loop repeat